MSAAPRKFEAITAKRQQVPLLVGLFGPSGSGKTFSALRLATGMQKVTGGDIYFIDTEAKRALHYADRFTFKHVEFGAPFGSLAYLEAMRWAVEQGARVIVVDSLSHEHESLGGYLQYHDAELQRMGGRMQDTFSAWVKPSNERRQMINGMLQLNANFVFCFRAKPKLKIERGKPPVDRGYMPIAGDEFLFEQTMSCLLLPGADGRPTWSPEEEGSRSMIKLPEQFRGLPLAEQLSETLGETLATWAAGGDISGANAKPKPDPAAAAETWANARLVELNAMLSDPHPAAYDDWMEKHGPALGKLTKNYPDMAAILNETIAQIREKI